MNDTDELVARAEQKLRAGGLWDVLAAKDMILEPAFIRGKHPALQAAFFRLFPPSKELAHELGTSLRSLRHGDVAARRKAAAYLEKQPRRSMNGYLQGWLKDPRTVSLLCEALDDEDSTVVDRVAACLGGIADRYHYVDLEIYERLVAKLQSANRELRETIAAALVSFPTPEKWTIVVDVLRDKPSRIAKMLLGYGVAEYGADMPAEKKVELRAVLCDLLAVERNGDVCHRLIRAIEAIGDAAVAERLRAVRLPPKAKGLKNDVARAIATIEARERRSER